MIQSSSISSAIKYSEAYPPPTLLYEFLCFISCCAYAVLFGWRPTITLSMYPLSAFFWFYIRLRAVPSFLLDIFPTPSSVDIALSPSFGLWNHYELPWPKSLDKPSICCYSCLYTAGDRYWRVLAGHFFSSVSNSSSFSFALIKALESPVSGIIMHLASSLIPETIVEVPKDVMLTCDLASFNKSLSSVC